VEKETEIINWEMDFLYSTELCQQLRVEFVSDRVLDVVLRGRWCNIITSRDQNAGRSHSMKIDDSSFKRAEEFKYLGTTLTDQNSIPEEIKGSLKTGNACCHSVQNFLFKFAVQKYKD